MTQEEMKQDIIDWAADVSVAVEAAAKDIKFQMKKSTVEADLKEAKYSAKKLIEKIDEYLESQKAEFKVGDIVASKVFSDGSFGLVRLNEDLINRFTSVDGFWYTKKDCDICEMSLGVFKEDTRHATSEEIAEYKAALNFHKHGRKPFEVKKGDVLSKDGADNFFVESTYFWFKEDFVSGEYELFKTVEEVNEWLGVADEGN